MRNHIETLSTAVGDGNGRFYRVSVLGMQRSDGEWEGWLEFTPQGGPGPVLLTPVETTQATRDALLFWATGLEPTYLSGALARAEDHQLSPEIHTPAR